jgi:uncharacterized Zn-binding protein involved in type VI secretion
VTKPAARLTDFHVCPQITVLVPHVGGPVSTPGEPTVLIGNLPAARVTDMATCVGPPDAIATGGWTTLIGGLPAARMSDTTVHGGAMMVGEGTVLIGDAPASVTVVRRGNIFIIVDRATKTITMVGVQEFSGDGATQAFVDACTAAINKAWSGTTTFEGSTYTVNCMVQGRLHTDGSANNPLANQVIVSKTTMTPAEHKQKDPAHVDPNNVTHIHNNEDDGGTMTVPHEFGHTMGLPDEYTEGPRNPDGTRSITRTGPPGGMMGYIDPGSKPTPANYGSLINGTGLNPK